LELRSRIERYLAGVYTTFPHYTSHLVDHSDEIVRVISLVLATADDLPGRAVVQPLTLNSTEVYLLLLAAYLHDSGMVVSEQEKIAAVESRAWQQTLRSDEAFCREHDHVQQLFADSDGSVARRYAAGLQERLLIAEFFRRQHARRSAHVINDALFVAR